MSGRRAPSSALAAALTLALCFGGPSAEAGAGSFCTYSSGVVHLNLAAEHQVRLFVSTVRFDEGRIRFADLADYSMRGPCGRATVWNTDRIRITESDPGNSRLQFDEQLGRFGPGRNRESVGISEIEVQLGTLRDIWVMGRPAGQHMSIGSRGINLNGDADVDLVSSRLAEVTVFLMDGDDSFSASGGHGTGDPFLPPLWGLLVVYGDDGDDALSGTSRRDVLDGEWGFDEIRGWGGSDDLRGGTEADRIWGGRGADYIDPGSWHDTVFAGPGDDFLEAQDLGPDDLVGGPHYDKARVDSDDNLISIEWTSPPH